MDEDVRRGQFDFAVFPGKKDGLLRCAAEKTPVTAGLEHESGPLVPETVYLCNMIELQKMGGRLFSAHIEIRLFPPGGIPPCPFSEFHFLHCRPFFVDNITIYADNTNINYFFW